MTRIKPSKPSKSYRESRETEEEEVVVILMTTRNAMHRIADVIMTEVPGTPDECIYDIAKKIAGALGFR